MTTYKEIRGTNIEAVASDPSNPVEGQVWYNTTTNVVKGFGKTATAAWSTGGSLNTARRFIAGAGTQTSALSIGGEDLAIVESYNGSTWTEVNDTNSPKTQKSGAAGANNTSAIKFGGAEIPTGLTELWNGTNWTEVNDMGTSRYSVGSAGIATAALAFGGRPPDPVALTELWNGTNWTEVNDMNTGREAVSGSGTQTSALAYGGSPPTTGKTESWNGTNWTEVADLATARRYLGGAGASNTSALAFGGFVPPNTAVTEEWTDPGIITKTLTS